MPDPNTQNILRKLYPILEAGEKGYATAATNVHRPGLKILFKRFAQQRAGFKNEILSTLQRLEGDKKPQSSVPGMIHRGRVAIFAAMTIEKDNQEKVILKEIAIGEGVAVRAFAAALEKDLPPPIREMVERQSEAIRKAHEQINLLRGRDGKRMVVRLYNSENDAEKAIQLLKKRTIRPRSSNKLP